MRKIQLALHDMGYSTNVNGVFDGRTEEQVKALQRSGGVFDDGKVNRATMAIFERRFTMRTPYVEAAREEAPNLHLDKASGWDDTPVVHHGTRPGPGADLKGWDAAHPPGALTRHTHTLSDAEKADALATLSQAARRASAYRGPGYKAELDPLMRSIVRKEAKPAHDKARDHKDPRKHSRSTSPHRSASNPSTRSMASMATGPRIRTSRPARPCRTSSRSRPPRSTA